MKRLYFDLETTGTDPETCAVHQIAGVIEIDGEIVEKFDFKLKPFKGAVIDDDALSVSNITIDNLRSYPSSKECYDSLIKILSRHCDKFDKTDKYMLVGYNILKFDNPFFRKFFQREGDDYFGSWFWANSIDVLPIASLLTENVRHRMKDFKLRTVAKTLKIEVDESMLHDAMYDIELTRKVLIKCREIFKILG